MDGTEFGRSTSASHLVQERLRRDQSLAPPRVGIAQRPLSANEYQGVGIQTANVTAWYINRFAYSTYDKAMRANWNCCLSPNLTGILNRAQTGWAPTGSWWSMRFGAEMTRRLTTDEIGRLLAIDAEFFERRIVMRSGPVRRADGCRVFPSLNHQHVLSLARRLICPAEVVTRSRAILDGAGLSSLEVVSLESIS